MSAPRTSPEDVCSLPSDQLHHRTAMLRRELLPLVQRRRTLPDGMSFDFVHTPDVQAALEDLVAFERKCCSGLSWKLDRPTKKVLRLSVGGLEPDSDFFRALDNPAGGDKSGGHLKRLAQASFLGAVTAFLLCCVAPLGVAAVLGTTVAAPLMILDDPVFIMGGAVAFAVPAWWWLKSRDSNCHGSC